MTFTRFLALLALIMGVFDFCYSLTLPGDSGWSVALIGGLLVAGGIILLWDSRS